MTKVYGIWQDWKGLTSFLKKPKKTKQHYSQDTQLRPTWMLALWLGIPEDREINTK